MGSMTMTGIGLPTSTDSRMPIATDPRRIRIATMFTRGASALY